MYVECHTCMISCLDFSYFVLLPLPKLDLIVIVIFFLSFFLILIPFLSAEFLRDDRLDFSVIFKDDTE